MADRKEIWVFSEKPSLLRELAGGARMLAQHTDGKVVALALDGANRAAFEAALPGADRAIWLDAPPEVRPVDDYVPTIVGLLEQGRPYALLVGATRRGRAVAARAAARLDVTVLTDVLDFSFNSDQLQARHLIFGGGAVRVDRPLAEPVIATVGPGVFAPADGGPPAESVEAPFIAPVLAPRLRGRQPRPAAKTDLHAARRVVCAGRGLGKQEDLAMVEELARALGAELACTRPLAEGLDWLPRERYIGISGAMIKPDLYLGVGVSGQAQHLIGMSESRVVVAINRDLNAPLCAQADYIVPEDLYIFLPALIQMLRARQ
jgi:electron transfer flavoprotein alpha subunit